MERVESFVSRMIEGWSARLFGAKLQPVQIAKRLIRAMEAHQTISLSKTFVPNSYVVSLSPSDFEQFAQYRRSLEQDLAEAILGGARDRNYTLLAFPTVEMERDEDLAPGDLRVSCALVDASGEEVTPDSKTLGALSHDGDHVRRPALGRAHWLPRAALPLSHPRVRRASGGALERRGGRRAALGHRASGRPAERPRRSPGGGASAAARRERDRSRRGKRRRPQRRGRLREARPPRVRRRRMVDRGFGEHERDPRERRGRAVPRARPVRRRGGDRPRRPSARAVIGAQRLPVPRTRFTELSLLF